MTTSIPPLNAANAQAAAKLDDPGARPMVSVAGIRGVVGKSLLPETFLEFALAFAATLPERKPVVLGSDTRPSRELVRHLVLAALSSSGVEVVDVGVVPTPTVGIMVRELNAAGGIAITASHNPVEWNALKFFGPTGQFLGEAENAALQEKLKARAFRRANVQGLGPISMNDDALDLHLGRVLRVADVEAVKARRFKVVVDCCNGAGATLTKRLLEALGCDADLFATERVPRFHREAEPLPENLGALCERVRETGADLGFALDPDADRLAIVDERGRAIGEERTLCLASDAVLSARPVDKRVIVANLSTTLALDRVAEKHDARLFRSKIGEAHVVAEMRRTGAAIGGEGNGGVIDPLVHMGRDAATGMALILDGLARRGGSLSEWNATFPDYVMLKEKVGLLGLDLSTVAEAIRSHFEVSEERCSRLDGMKLDLGDATLHFRPSGTEPIARVFVESESDARNAEIWSQARQIIEAGRATAA